MIFIFDWLRMLVSKWEEFTCQHQDTDILHQDDACSVERCKRCGDIIINGSAW